MIINDQQYSDLFDLLKDQIKYVPINPGTYFLNMQNFQIYSIKLDRYLILTDGDKVNLKTSSKQPRFSYKRIICFIQNGLLTEMSSILDKRFWCIEIANNIYKWISIQEYQSLENKHNLELIWNNNPELYQKDGFFDEGIIAFREMPGYYFVPTTNGTMALNLETHEAVFTYSKEKLKIQTTKRGERKYTLNKRLCGKSTMFLHRAVAYLTISLPDKYRDLNKSLKDCILSLDVDHIDAIPANNYTSNLQYLTRQENLIKKLEQEGDPRVIITTWLSPEGEVIKFRSLLLASETIGCPKNYIFRLFKGWKNKEISIKGWTLLTEKPKHRHEDYYRYFEQKGISRYDLTSFKDGLIVYAKEKENKIVYIYESLMKFCFLRKISKSTIDGHLMYKGPLEAYDGLILFPLKYEALLRESGYLDKYFFS